LRQSQGPLAISSPDTALQNILLQPLEDSRTIPYIRIILITAVAQATAEKEK